MTSTALAQDKDVQAVTSSAEQLRLAMVDGDNAKLEKLIAPELSYGHSGGHVDDHKEFLEKFKTGKSDFVSIDIKDQTVFVSGKTGIVRHKLDAITNDNGKPGEVHLLVMQVWQKKKKNWVLLARQAVKLTQ